MSLFDHICNVVYTKSSELIDEAVPQLLLGLDDPGRGDLYFEEDEIVLHFVEAPRQCTVIEGRILSEAVVAMKDLIHGVHGCVQASVGQGHDLRLSALLLWPEKEGVDLFVEHHLALQKYTANRFRSVRFF